MGILYLKNLGLILETLGYSQNQYVLKVSDFSREILCSIHDVHDILTIFRYDILYNWHNSHQQ